MSDAPNEIWVEDQSGDTHSDKWQYGDWDLQKVMYFTIKYIREDVALAMVAASLEVAAKRMDEGFSYNAGNAVRGVTPDDAKAALDALLKAEREKALREAAGVPRRLGGQKFTEDAILALIEQDAAIRRRTKMVKQIAIIYEDGHIGDAVSAAWEFGKALWGEVKIGFTESRDIVLRVLDGHGKVEGFAFSENGKEIIRMPAISFGITNAAGGDTITIKPDQAT